MTKELPKTDEWKAWTPLHSTRPELEEHNDYVYPSYDPATQRWTIYHPYSSYYMIVPNREYKENIENRLHGRYSDYRPSESRIHPGKS